MRNDAYWFENPRFDNVYEALAEMNLFEISEGLSNPGVLLDRARGLQSQTVGHCYGMATTSILYEQNRDLSPNPGKVTYKLDTSEAMPSIIRYQRDSLLLEPFWVFFTPLNKNMSPAFDRVSSILPKPVELLMFADEGNNHAVVAYKTVKTGKGDDLIFLYDNNDPYSRIVTYGDSLRGRIDETGGFDYSSYDSFRVKDVHPYADSEPAKIAKAQQNAWWWLINAKKIVFMSRDRRRGHRRWPGAAAGSAGRGNGKGADGTGGAGRRGVAVR